MWFGLRKSRSRRRELSRLIDDEMVGLLEPGVEVEGILKIVSGMIRLNTRVKGEIHCDGALVVADQGKIEGEVWTKLISIAGKVEGTVHASERLEIKEAGSVVGDIYTPCLVIDPGGYFDGQCHMPMEEHAQTTINAVEVKETSQASTEL